MIGGYFTRWMEVYAIHTQVEPVAQMIFVEFYSRFGTSLEIHSDQGGNFENQLLQDISKLLQIKKDVYIS